MLTRREFLKVGAVAGAGVIASQWMPRRLFASVQIAQTPLLGRTIPKYVEPVPLFGPGGNALRVTGPSITVTMSEIQQKVLPASFYTPLAAPYSAGTYVWAYNVGGSGALYPGVTIEAQRGTPTTVTYVNNLPGSAQLLQYITTDQSIHWANPNNVDMMVMNAAGQMIGNPLIYNADPPVVVHLHGAEVPSDFDGGPDQWFTPTGRHGAGYRTLGTPAGNAAVYQYPNGQEATTLWFHDHALGATRLNVYRGLAAFYLLRDAKDTGLPTNLLGLPAGPYEREIAIQDRQFDTNGQLFFPDSAAAAGLNGPPPNPLIHPYWNPEFFGDAMVVNGKTWPFLNVEPRRYRFRLLDGCNARFLELYLMNKVTGLPGPDIWVIGDDGGLIDVQARLNGPGTRLLMSPGERYDVIIDFAGFAGQTLTLLNSARAPYPGGAPADPQTTGQIMQFRVTLPLNGTDTSFNPAAPGAALRGGANQMPLIVRLATPTVKRQLTLVEVAGPGGPVEVLVNNTKWNGKRDDAAGTQIPGSIANAQGDYMTELPAVGATEQWEIINLTMDAHPIHLHLVQFQLMNRQGFQTNKYRALYDSLFPGGTYGGVQPAGTWGPVVYPAGVFIPAYGPPSLFNTPNAELALGGNPAVGPFLQGKPTPPRPEEAGWKDTVQMYPGEVTRILVRWAPQQGGTYPFDATAGPGYVWHCHIVDHEDNEMMRPYHPV